MNNSKITKHHRLVKSAGGNKHYDNILPITQVKHRAFHTIHGNDLLPEQIVTLVDIMGKAINSIIANDIKEMVQSYEPEDLYNPKCVNMAKLIRHIEETKNNN